MNSKENIPQKFTSIGDLLRALGLPKPLHPLVSLVNYATIKTPEEELPKAMSLDFYKISYKFNLQGKLKYGQHHYDFDEGGISFIGPNQIIASKEEEKDYSGYTLLFHPDFLYGSCMAKILKSMAFSLILPMKLYIYQQRKKRLFQKFLNIFRKN